MLWGYDVEAISCANKDSEDKCRAPVILHPHAILSRQHDIAIAPAKHSTKDQNPMAIRDAASSCHTCLGVASQC